MSAVVVLNTLLVVAYLFTLMVGSWIPPTPVGRRSAVNTILQVLVHFGNSGDVAKAVRVCGGANRFKDFGVSCPPGTVLEVSSLGLCFRIDKVWDWSYRFPNGNHRQR